MFRPSTSSRDFGATSKSRTRTNVGSGLAERLRQDMGGSTTAPPRSSPLDWLTSSRTARCHLGHMFCIRATTHRAAILGICSWAAPRSILTTKLRRVAASTQHVRNGSARRILSRLSATIKYVRYASATSFTRQEATEEPLSVVSSGSARQPFPTSCAASSVSKLVALFSPNGIPMHAPKDMSTRPKIRGSTPKAIVSAVPVDGRTLGCVDRSLVHERAYADHEGISYRAGVARMKKMLGTG